MAGPGKRTTAPGAIRPRRRVAAAACAGPGPPRSARTSPGLGVSAMVWSEADHRAAPRPAPDRPSTPRGQFHGSRDGGRARAAGAVGARREAGPLDLGDGDGARAALHRDPGLAVRAARP